MGTTASITAEKSPEPDFREAILTRVTGLTLVSLASSAMAFGVEWLLARRFGGAPLVDAYRVASTLLVAALQLFYIQTIPLALVPWLTQRRIRNEADAGRWLRVIERAVFVGTLVLTIATFLGRNSVTTLLAPGLNAEGRAALNVLLPQTMAAAGLVTWSGVVAAGLATNRIFWPAPVTPFLINVALAASILLFPQAITRGALGTATLAGASMAAVVHWFCARRPSQGFTPTVAAHDYGTPMARPVALVLPLFVAAAVLHIWNVLIYRQLTWIGPGVAARYGYAFRVMSAVQAPAAMLATIALPSFSFLRAKEPGMLRASFFRSVRFTAAVSASAAVALWVIAPHVVQLLFGRGAWTGDAVIEIVAVLRVLLIGAPAGAVTLLCQSALAATQGSGLTVYAASISVIATAVGFRLIHGGAGVALVWSVSAWLAAGYLLWVCGTRLPRRDRTANVKRLHWVCQAPSPYNNHLFASLSRAGVDLHVYFRQGTIATHPWEQIDAGRFPSRVYGTVAGLDWRLVWTMLRNPRDVFLTGCWQDPTSQAVILTRIALRLPYSIWNDTPSFRPRPWLKRTARACFLRLAFRHAVGVLGTGKPALAALQRMGCPAELLVNFPYFIDLDMFTARHHRHGSPEVLRFGSSGRLHRNKGYDVALNALAILTRRGLDFRYCIAGIGPEEPALRRLVSELGIAEKVTFMGWVQSEDLPEFYAGLDLFLHPSREEPYGVAVIEAMASGLTVVASDETSAAIDRIADGTNGFLHRSGSASSLDAAICRALAGPRTEIERNARITAEAWPVTKAVETIHAILARAKPCGDSLAYSVPKEVSI